jgi:hypothetical protein
MEGALGAQGEMFVLTKSVLFARKILLLDNI